MNRREFLSLTGTAGAALASSGPCSRRALAQAATYFRSLNESSDFNIVQIAQDLSYPQGAGTSSCKKEYGPSNFDITHRDILTTVWHLPFFKSQQGIEVLAPGGWACSSIEQRQAGVPTTILNGARLGIMDINLDGSLVSGLENTRASVLHGGDEFRPSGEHTVRNTITNPYLAGPGLRYVPTLLGNTGMLGRNTYRMPGIPSVDWSLSKATHLSSHGILGSEPSSLKARAYACNTSSPPFSPRSAATGTSSRVLRSDCQYSR